MVPTFKSLRVNDKLKYMYIRSYAHSLESAQVVMQPVLTYVDFIHATVYVASIIPTTASNCNQKQIYFRTGPVQCPCKVDPVHGRTSAHFVFYMYILAFCEAFLWISAGQNVEDKSVLMSIT